MKKSGIGVLSGLLALIIVPGLLFWLLPIEGLAGDNRQPASDTGTDCAVQRVSCEKKVEPDGLRIVFDIQPKPVTAMKDLRFIVTLEKKGKPLEDADVSIDLAMPGMFMGKNRPVLTHQGNGRYEGMGVLPYCPSGRKIWKAEMRVRIDDTTVPVSYRFEVQ